MSFLQTTKKSDPLKNDNLAFRPLHFGNVWTSAYLTCAGRSGLLPTLPVRAGLDFCLPYLCGPVWTSAQPTCAGRSSVERSGPALVLSGHLATLTMRGRFSVEKTGPALVLSGHLATLTMRGRFSVEKTGPA